MKRDLTLDAQLDWLLAEWHHHCKTFKIIRQKSSCPQFENARSSKGWDTTEEIAAQEVDKLEMETIDTAYGDMNTLQRYTCEEMALNCHSGDSEWMHPCVPEGQRPQLKREVRSLLHVRLGLRD